jgi:F-box and WD-40 domain protein CDC4
LLCQKFSYRKLTKEERSEDLDPGDELDESKEQWLQPSRASRTDDTLMREQLDGGASSAVGEVLRTRSLDRAAKGHLSQRRPIPITYRSHFKQRYMVETAWRQGGDVDSRQITPDQGVVTSLHLTNKYIVVALDNAKIHVFDTFGNHQKTLQGHVMGVWAMVPWGDLLVSGGCDRDVRITPG